LDDLSFLTVTELTQAIRDRKVSAVEVLDAHLAQIAKHNSKLNAIITLDEANARERARQADAALARGESWGKLHGIPVTIKDALETAGLRTTSGYKPWANYIPEHDAPVVAQLRQAGAIILGKTNLPARAAGAQSVNALFGRTINPWNLDCTCGGSSGGGATAVAAGFVPLDIGSDISGSLREPASFCGVCGLKPTGGRVPILGHRSSARPLRLPKELLPLLQMPCVGPLARSVGDLRLALQVIADPKSPVLEPAPRKDTRALRIAWTDEMSLLPISAETRAAIQNMARALNDAKMIVEKHPAAGFDYDEAWEMASEALATIDTVMQPTLTRTMRRLGSLLLSRRLPAHPVMRGFVRGAAMEPTRVAELFKRRESLIQQIDTFLGDWDVWIAPAFPRTAFSHRPLKADIEIDGEQISQDMAEVMTHVVPNFTGHPSVAIPIGLSPDGLPIGVQLVGRRWGEMALLNVAEQIAEVLGGYRRPPGF
jgi:amidase